MSKKMTILAVVAAISGLIAFGGGQTALAATLVVDDDGTYDAATSGCDGSDTAYSTIQGAVDVANTGDTILVCDGSYAGFEADINGITVRAASSPVINGTGISFDGQVVGVLVTADDVTVQGFEITGQYSTGIWVVAAADDVQILENTVDQTGFDPGCLVPDAATGCSVPGNIDLPTWDGSGIQSQGDNTLISNNRVKIGPSSRPHNGINVFSNSYTIQNNTVTIFEGPRYQVGINNRGSATVAHNRVVSPDKIVGVWTRVFGIWFYGGTGIIEGNQVSKTDYAVWLTGSSAVADVAGNTLVNNGIGTICEAGATGTFSRNRIKNFWWDDSFGC